MFRRCTSLTTAPALPAATLLFHSYDQMFRGCSSLNEVTCLATDISATECNTDWLSNVASTGTFYKSPNMSGWTTGASGIPSGWTVEDADTTDYLTFTTNEPNVTISMSHYGTNQTTTKPVIYISRDKTNWTQWDFTPITLSLADQKIYMYGDNSSGISRGFSNYSTFQFSGSVGASGDCTTLLTINGSNAVPQYAFYRLFVSCTSLTTAPELPATTLATSCYENMFWNCTSLTTAPALPATTLGQSCYYQMFAGCTSLTTAPALPATTLVGYCYQRMFNGCTSLNEVTCLAENISASGCTSYWLDNVSASGTFTKSANMSGWPSGGSGIPSGWTVVNA